MGRLSLVSLGLFVLPVAVTTGLLVGLDAFRTAHGQTPLFVSNKVRNSTYCQKAFGITPPSDGQQFTPSSIDCKRSVLEFVAVSLTDLVNPNQWGWNTTDPGALCMNVTTYDNGTYPTNTTAPEWSITWQYPPGPPTQPVHAFPNIKVEPPNTFPLVISNVDQIPIEVEWNYGVGDDKPEITDSNALAGDLLNANVALDMFVDTDSNNATSTVDAKYEVMIWLGIFGSATQPIGLALGPRATQVINGTTFNLYFGVNGLQQTVLTWAATTPVTSFYGDVAPLLQGLTGIGGPTTSDYLGYLAFGSETLSATTNVTLSVPYLRMDVKSK